MKIENNRKYSLTFILLCFLIFFSTNVLSSEERVYSSSDVNTPVLGSKDESSHYPYVLENKYSSSQKDAIFFWFQIYKPSSFSSILNKVPSHEI